ncbi:hypothetical protein BaRGS_00028944 [Batillaria attramentaria]|uniref:Zinc finger CCCH domain-containing protein 14 n=1 Tax=Batillaria attramentaria TaxID=370345 RepID=A0ABD0JXG7_9CAEN
MEIGNEISQKIRSAIKAKLVELGAYVDEELPDYIMVMVANKKSLTQMTDDLSLFLGTNTDKFTTWLHGLLVKLQSITSDPISVPSKAEKSDKPSKSKDQSCASGKEAKASKSTSGPGDGGGKPKRHSLDDAVDSRKESRKHKLDSDKDVGSVAELDSSAKVLAKAPEEAASPEEPVVTAKTTTPEKVLVPEETPEPRKAETVKRRGPVSVVASITRDEDEEDNDGYDPYNPAVGTVASVIKVTARKSSVPPKLQANKSLLLKAMSEAEKSIETQRRVAITPIRPFMRAVPFAALITEISMASYSVCCK